MKNTKNILELYEKYKEFPGVSDMYELCVESTDGDFKDLLDLLLDLEYTEVIAKAVEFEKKLPSHLNDWQRIKETHDFIMRNI